MAEKGAGGGWGGGGVGGSWANCDLFVSESSPKI